MSNPMQADHPALGKYSSSLRWAEEQGPQWDQSPDFERIRFPFPGAPKLTLTTMAPHTAIIGATGSGKTILLKHFMRSLLPAPAEDGGLRFRSVIYDPKRELFPFLRQAGIPSSQIIVTHPFDTRAAAWDLASDFTEPAQIEELAELIVPHEEGQRAMDNSEFFQKAARIIVQEVIESLQSYRAGKWELRDIIESLFDLRYLKAVLFKTPSGRNTWSAYLEPLERDRGDKTGNSLNATLHSYARPFQALAALWHTAEFKFSLDRWHRGSGILLLGADPKRERTLQRLNRLILRRASQLVLSRKEERPVDLTWFFLDEIREAGKLNGLRQLMTEGRSKGARVLMGFQDIEGLKGLYGDFEAEEMVGLCSNRILLHIDNARTRKWASEFMGEDEFLEETTSEATSQSKQGPSHTETVNRAIKMRTNVLPKEFHEMPLGNPAIGVRLWFSVPGNRNEGLLTPGEAKQAIYFGHDVREDAFIERPASDQQRCEWSDEDVEDLDLSLYKENTQVVSSTGGAGILLGSLTEHLTGAEDD